MVFLANSLLQYNMDITFLTYRNKECVLQKLDPGVKHEHLDISDKGGSIVSIINSVRKIHQYIKNNNFDLAIAFLSPSQIRLVPACWFTKTKVLLSQRADPYNKGASFISHVIANVINTIFSAADLFVFQTVKAKQFYSKKVQRASAVIPNPIKPLVRTCERNTQSTEKSIVCVARLELKQKRQDVLIEAFNKLSKEYPEYVLKLYGDGEDEKAIRGLIGRNEKIKLCGVATDVAEAIQNAAMFVLSSDYEGIPNALLEAMSIGLPCISTDCSPGGAAMLIDNHKNGIIVDVHDADKLYKAMKYYVENPSEAEKYAKEAVNVNTKFSPQKITEMWVSYINNKME
ncbi:MAG: glycosyltransferase [Oscillospiraceae bacterium]|nr:glycosyltransferase [Oscillospiraceae bacterium]